MKDTTRFEIFSFCTDPGRKFIKEGELPTLNLPKKSIIKKEIPPRLDKSIRKREACEPSAVPSPVPTYKSYTDFIKRVSALSLPLH